MLFTVFGATGSIGTRLVRELRLQGHDCLVPDRHDIPEGIELGFVFYCIGVTADFRNKLTETVEAHVCHLVEVLKRCTFTRLCYLSSTRVYSGLAAGSETAKLHVDPHSASDLYNISKLMGESACLSILPNTLVVRLSNVFNPGEISDNFLSAVRSEAASGHLFLHTALNSAKDYILITDVIEMLPQIIVQGQERIYNLASGRNTTHQEIVECFDCVVEIAIDAPTVFFPTISIERLEREFGYTPRNVLEILRSYSV